MADNEKSTEELKSIEEIVQDVIKWFANAEPALTRAGNNLWRISNVFDRAQSLNIIKQGQAMKLRNEARSLAGEVSALHTRVVEFHEKCTKAAQEKGVDDPTARYAELSPIDPSIPQTRGGGER